MTNDFREWPKSQVAWGFYNLGLLIGVARTRRAAVAEVEERTGVEWKHCRHYMEIHKVRVEKYAP